MRVRALFVLVAAATLFTLAATSPARADESQVVATTAAQTALPVAAPTVPMFVDATKINPGDTAWMLAATALVLLMTIPGLALFYAGMVRKKNVLGTMAHSFISVCIVTVLWVALGYSLAFTPGSPFLGGLDRLMLHGMAFFKDPGRLTVSHIAPTIPESVFVMYQMTFAIITPALITGAFAERMKFSAMLAFVALWSLVVYVPVAHWVWEPGGFLAARGVLDFAGGTVVHINAGISGLVAAVMLGPRNGYGKEIMAPHNLVLTVTGACLLWVGWFGFNAGSALAADGRAGMAMLTTQFATATGALAWMAAEWLRRGVPSLLGMVSGAVAGLVAITPASGFVDTDGALVIGVVAGVACYFASTWFKSLIGYDDSLDVFGVHAIGGTVGALLTGVFAVKEIGGASTTFGTQLLGVVVTFAYAGVATALILFAVGRVIGLRVTRQHEHDGLDLSQHNEMVR
ncbi:Amt family ammonium transporter [Actimicrobium sp. GrIS 1.19]|uniref:ammonium transporter n=1 Tax=Actimicrobium sp. GrIS 1.19 TaxID=3071708 RepID=UPI002DF9A708|nr:Amt family ammonium transporter [Actimicrobium sp. GrIS 1.19]